MANDNTTRVLELLGQQHGVERRTFCLIDGFPYVLWANGQRPPPSGGFGGRTGLVCLNPPDTEWSLGLDLKKAKADASALTVGLRNIDDPDDTSTKFFAKLFAPARFSATGSLLALFARNDTISQIDGDAETIPADRSLADWADGGLAYIGSEVFRYTKTYDYPSKENDALAEFQGVTKGQFPCVGTTWGFTYTPRSGDGDETTTQADGIVIANVPVTWIGRRFALYITCWDPARGAYLPLNESLLAWVGSISDGISYRASGDQWLVSGENILKQTDTKIATDVRRAEIDNCFVAPGAGLVLDLYGATNGRASLAIPVGTGVYTARTLATEILSSFADVRTTLGNWNASGWSGTTTLTSSGGLRFEILFDEDGSGNPIKARFKISIDSLQTEYNGSVRINPHQGSGFDALASGNVLHILGFSKQVDGPVEPTTFEELSLRFVAEIEADEDVCLSFHSTLNARGRRGNSQLLHLRGAADWTTQKDTLDAAPDSWGVDGTVGYVYADISGVTGSGETNLKAYVDQFESVTPSGDFAQLVLRPDGLAMLSYKMASTSFAGAPWIGHRYSEQPAKVILCYFPASIILGEIRGPFELLLYPLLSTGTAGYNDSKYDVLPRHLSVGIQADLVDKDSFLDADREVFSKLSSMGTRNYPITDAVPWSDLARSECQLFGYALVWDHRSAKLRLRNVVAQETLTSTDEVNDSNSATHAEFPDFVLSNKTTVNHWTIKIRDPRRQTDVKREVFDGVGVATTGGTVGETISHRGIDLYAKYFPEEELQADLIRALVSDRKDLFRNPWPVVRRTLSPSMTGRIGIGETVRFVATNMPDPFGSGAMSCDCWALVLDRTQSFTDYKGTCTLMLYSPADTASRANWAASAIVDNEAISGGWDSATKRLYLRGGDVADQWGTNQVTRGYPDGSRFSEGDIVNIIARNPGDPTSAQSWTALLVDKDFGEDHPEALTLDAATTLTGYDTTGATEYVVVSADYASAAAAQQLDQAYTADDDTKRIGLARARRYG